MFSRELAILRRAPAGRLRALCACCVLGLLGLAPAGARAELGADLQGRLGLLRLERSGGGSAEAHLAGGLRGGLRLQDGELLVLGVSAGYLLGYASSGTDAVSVRTLHHLVDLRAEPGVKVGPYLAYLAVGALLDAASIRLHALGEDVTDLSVGPGLVYGAGLRAEDGRLVLKLELLGQRRAGKNDLVAELGAGVHF